MPLPAPRADAAASFAGDYLYILGGTGLNGATTSVYRLFIVQGKPAPNPITNEPEGWFTAPASQQIPAPRARASFFNASGTMYLIGGVDATGALQFTTLWAIADSERPTSAGTTWTSRT